MEVAGREMLKDAAGDVRWAHPGTQVQHPASGSLESGTIHSGLHGDQGWDQETVTRHLCSSGQERCCLGKGVDGCILETKPAGLKEELSREGLWGRAGQGTLGSQGTGMISEGPPRILPSCRWC